MHRSSFLFLFIISLCCISWLTGCAHSPSFSYPLSAFTKVPAEYVHVWSESTHPFTGAAVIDSDNDGVMEIFISGGEGQRDALLLYKNKNQGLIDIAQGKGLTNETATYGVTAIDLDNDGDTDLIVARDDGVFIYVNQDGKFESKKIPVNFPKQSIPFSVTVADIDQDGDGDLYISIFVKFSEFRSGVFNDATHAKSNRLLLNNGALTFTDITQSAGVQGKNNTFFSSFVDLDGDGWQDLVLAQNTGEVEIFRNNKNLTFTAIPSDSGFGFWMGLAIGDIDNDGDQDLFFSNIGDSIPHFLTRGDLQLDQRSNNEWLLLRNDGNFKFSDVTETYGLTDEGFAWGAVFEDLNLDGQLDLLVAQNYIKWPLHKLFKLPGKVLLQVFSENEYQFHRATELGIDNPFYGQSPLIIDLNADAKPDIVWLNMDGPVRAFLNTSPANSLLISPADTVAMLGTRITVELANGKTYTKEIVANTGLLTDQTPELFFGLGNETKVERVIINRPKHKIEIIEAPVINQRIHIQ